MGTPWLPYLSRPVFQINRVVSLFLILILAWRVSVHPASQASFVPHGCLHSTAPWHSPLSLDRFVKHRPASLPGPPFRFGAMSSTPTFKGTISHKTVGRGRLPDFDSHIPRPRPETSSTTHTPQTASSDIGSSTMSAASSRQRQNQSKRDEVWTRFSPFGLFATASEKKEVNLEKILSCMSFLGFRNFDCSMPPIDFSNHSWT